MVDPEKQNVPENESDSFLGIKNVLNSLKKWVKEFLSPQQSIEQKKENKQEKTTSKEQQEAGLLKKEILDYKKDILQNNEIIASTKTDLEKIKRSASLKKAIPATYVPKHVDTEEFVHQSDRISAPYIAQAADDLRKDVDRPFLSWLLS